MEDSVKLVLGMKETREVVDFAIALGKGIEASLEDGKISFADVPNFMPAFITLIPAVEDFSKVSLELEAASKEEIAELKAYISDNLELKDVSVEKFIESAVGIALDIYTLVNTFFYKKEEESEEPKVKEKEDEGAQPIGDEKG